MDKKKLKLIEQQVKIHKINKCKLSTIELDIEEIQDELNICGFDKNLNEKLIKLEKAKRKFSRITHGMDRAIDTLSNEEKQLIELRYFKGKTWSDVSDVLKINANHLCNVIRYRILNDISNCIDI